jgi:hypothetical protein
MDDDIIEISGELCTSIELTKVKLGKGNGFIFHDCTFNQSSHRRTLIQVSNVVRKVSGIFMR